ncbi:MAG: nitroreductase family deazaflavin-dependent oxidoreductase [Deltaproteobacteria bacterium]|nr:nitroreductase family deazaflavin-dependent oxidoreductase [Deltaproteobacteria bacterium]
MTRAGDFKRWLYRGQRQNRLARLLNRISATIHAWGVAPDYFVTLEVEGRRSGRRFSFPLVMVKVEGERYLVSMLGEDVAWVRNLRAAGGRAVLHHGRSEDVRLSEVSVEQRASILKSYLQCAPGARPHIAVDKDAPLSEFVSIAPSIPVFQVSSYASGPH